MLFKKWEHPLIVAVSLCNRHTLGCKEEVTGRGVGYHLAYSVIFVFDEMKGLIYWRYNLARKLEQILSKNWVVTIVLARYTVKLNKPEID